MRVTEPGYPLRPEIVESTYYLYHYATMGTRAPRRTSLRTYYLYHYATMGTRAPRRPSLRRASQPGQVPLANVSAGKLNPAHYLQMGETLWRDFVKYCRTDEGYAALKR